MKINQVEIEHIERLNSIQLTKLLHSLLQIELEKNGINGEAFVPFNINTGDGGDDGRVQWTGEKLETKWLRNQFCLFQNKATSLGASACYKEILKPIVKGGPKKLKPRVEELVRANGCYTLFISKDLNKDEKQERIDKFREAIRDAGFDNHSTIQIEIYDTNSIKDWVNENIGTVTLVQEFNGINRPGFILWEEWDEILNIEQIPYIKNETIDKYINNIHELIKLSKPIRIIGHSGLGKTRLVLEAFRENPSKPEILQLQKQLVYFEIGKNGELDVLVNYITSHKRQEGILIIDSCDEEAHKALSGLVNSISKFKLITIDVSSSTQEETYFKLDRDNQRDIIQGIIEELLGNSHSQNDRNYLNNICEGYPWMAVKFCSSIKKNGITDFSSTLPGDFIKKLLFGRSEENEIEYKVIRSCSVFSSFGFLDDELRLILSDEHKKSLKNQLKFIRKNIYSEKITKERFYEICQKYKRKDIIEKRGTQYIVKPTVLAISLASDWLRNTPPSKVISILEPQKGSVIGQKFVERLKDLDQFDEAQNVVHELWGPNSPFGSAEVLNTEWGSRLFRYVVQVNPVSTARALRNAFGNLSKDEIRNIKDGRRNLVWAIEKLCFRKETFPIAAKILFAFAVSENESYANNSENQFRQLYQLFIPGTEADLNERLKIIKWGLEKKDDDFNRIAINALGRGILNEDYTRMGGAERQGSKAPLKDHNPNWEEIYKYWEEAVSILTDFACSDNMNKELAKSKLANAFRTLIRDWKEELVIDTIKKITDASQTIWVEGINAIKRTLAFETLSNEVSDKLESLIDEITPTDLKHVFRLKVTMPEWASHEKDEDGRYIDKPKIGAQEFAEKLVEENVEWFDYLPDLLNGEQRQAFNFGKRFGELYQNKDGFLTKAFDAFAQVPEKDRNIELIAGFINGCKDKTIKAKAIDNTISNTEYNRFAFYLTRVSDPELKDLEKLFEIVGDNKLPISYFKNFQYGRVLDNLDINEFLSLCKKIADYGKEGLWTSLSIIFMHCYGDEEKWIKYKDFIKNLISKENMLIETSHLRNIDHSYWSSSADKLLTNSNDDEFAKIISLQIIEFCAELRLNHSLDPYLKNTLKILLDDYYESIWEIIGDGLIGDPLTYFHLKDMLGVRNGNRGHQGLLFQKTKLNKKTLNWVRKHSDKAPARIANMMPLDSGDEGKIVWHPFSKSIIDEFGEQDEVLNELSANMGTFGSTGTSVPYYKKQKILLEQLSDHPSSKVQEWAEQMIEYTERYIKREELEDEERYG